MGVSIEIHDVPEAVHRRLEQRAAASGESLSEHVRAILKRSAARPTPDELADRIRARSPVRLTEPTEDTIRRLRGSLD